MLKYDIQEVINYKGEEAGLILKETESNTTHLFSYDEIREKIIIGAIQVSGIKIVNNEIVVENRDKLAESKIEQKEDLKLFKTGDSLQEVIGKVAEYKKRYVFKDLIKWVDGEIESQIAALYGLRRTGKTVLLLQICDYYTKLGKKVAYTELDRNTDNDKFVKELARLVDERYDLVVIDEITFLKRFLEWGSRLAGIYSRLGVKIIIAGTQSLMIEAASYDTLFDRIVKFNTTYISYQEFNSLYSAATVLDYIRYGGILSASRIVKEGSFDKYINTAIIDNIEHTLDSYSKAERRWDDVFSEYCTGNLKSVIQLYLMTCSEKLLINDINNGFVDRNLGSALQLAGYIDLEDADIVALSDYTRYVLGIHANTELGENLVYDINKLLTTLDFMMDAEEYRYKSGRLQSNKFPIFVQPGLQYDQAIQTIDAITNSIEKITLGVESAEELKKIIMHDLEGRLLETVIRLNLIKLVESNKVSKKANIFSLNIDGKEIDIVVKINREDVTLIEVKRSEKIVPNQYRWLCDTEFNKFIEKEIGRITRRIVVYMGESKLHKADSHEILYINATDWLLTTDITKEMMDRSK